MAAEIRRRFPKIQAVTGDCQARLDFPDGHFDRYIAVHVLEHLPNLPACIREAHRLLDKQRGQMLVVIPCEGSPAYSLARKISAERVYNRHFKGGYTWLISREHINRPHEILAELDPYFTVERKVFFPLPFLPFVFNNLCIGLSLQAAPVHERGVRHRRGRIHRLQPGRPPAGGRRPASSDGTISPRARSASSRAPSKHPAFKLVRGDNLDLPALDEGDGGLRKRVPPGGERRRAVRHRAHREGTWSRTRSPPTTSSRRCARTGSSGSRSRRPDPSTARRSVIPTPEDAPFPDPDLALRGVEGRLRGAHLRLLRGVRVRGLHLPLRLDPRRALHPRPCVRLLPAAHRAPRLAEDPRGRLAEEELPLHPGLRGGDPSRHPHGDRAAPRATASRCTTSGPRNTSG